jgi:hypothetical protein
VSESVGGSTLNLDWFCIAALQEMDVADHDVVVLLIFDFKDEKCCCLGLMQVCRSGYR